MMLSDTPFDPQNSFWAPFPLRNPPNIHDYYKFNCRKSKNLTIMRLSDWSGNSQIEIMQPPDWHPALVRQVPDKIRRLPDWSYSHHCKIRRLPDWSGSCQIEIKQLPKYQATPILKVGAFQIDQVSARFRSGSWLFDQDPGLWEV